MEVPNSGGTKNSTLNKKQDMKTKIYIFLTSLFVSAIIFCSCDTYPEAEQLLKPKTYDDQYYANLRAFKKSDHQISYGWYSDYSQTYSPGQHFLGLPDSIDIISLWGGIPTPSTNPIAYDEMRFVQKVKGTRMLSVKIIRMQSETWTTLDSAGIIQYGDTLLSSVFKNDLDGLDLDYEPEGDYLTGNNLTILVKYLGQFLGPMSVNPEKLLVIDYYSTRPPADVEPYINYLVNQAYTQGTTTNSAANLQSRYNLVASWCPPEKFIVTENIGDWWPNGGSPFTEADGNTLTPEGNRMYSLEGMARWNPSQGKKGGWGAFYFIRDYNLDPPYKFMRRCIQIVNPAVF
jgi:hypothetical protein